MHDLPYAQRNAKTLLANLYLPYVGDAPHPFPVILWLYPGGWIAGDRRRSPDLSRFFAQRGFAMASVDYSLSRDATYPAALEDVITAIQWLRDVSGSYQLDPERIGLWGASAGGHLAALAALSVPQIKVKAVCAVYPPVDFLKMPRSVQDYESRFLGAPVQTVPDLVRQVNPATYAHPGAPPFLLLHGRDDVEVPPNQSELLYEALRAQNNDVTLSLVDGLGHGFLDNDDFQKAPPGRHVIRALKPGEKEYTVEAPPLTFGTIENFFRRCLQNHHGYKQTY